MAIVTKPIILDETGKGIRDALDSASASILASITDGYNKDMTLQEVVDARGEFTSLGQRLTYEKGKTNQLEQELEETLQDVKDYVDDAADKILADITDEFNIDGTLQEVVDARGNFVSLGQRLDNDDERLGVLEQTTRDLEYWKTTNNALPKVTGEGTDITLDNTADSPLTLGFKASESTQESTTGKNLLPNNIVSQTLNGITVTKNKDKSLKFNGTATVGTNFVLINNLTINSGTYTLSLQNRKKGIGIYSYVNSELQVDKFISAASEDNIQSVTFTINENITFNEIRLYVPEGTELNNLTVYSQIENGNSMTSYEKYTGGQPSPSPDYPQDIHIVKGDNEIVIENKNWFDINDTVFYEEGSHSIQNNVLNIIGTTGSYGHLIFNKLYKSGIYTFKDTVNTGTGTKLLLRIYNSNNEDITSNTSLTGFEYNSYYKALVKVINATDSLTFTVLNNTRFRLGFASYIDNTSYSNLQLEKGTTATPYTEHKEQNYSLTLGSLELCNINNYVDEFFKNVPECEYYDSTLEEGKWYKLGKIGKVVLDGSENWVYALLNNRHIFYHDITGKITSKVALLCSHYKYSSLAWQLIESNYICEENGNNVIFIRDDTINSANDFKAWLSTHNTEVYYVLATPRKTLLSDTLQEELENIYYAMAYQDQTNISQVNEDRPFVISASTVLDLNTLVSRVAVLESEV